MDLGPGDGRAARLDRAGDLRQRAPDRGRPNLAEALERESDAVIGQQLADKLPEIVAAAAQSFANVDNLTVLNGAQGISEIMAQVIGQAGPALDLARDTLSAHRNGRAGAPREDKPAG